MSPLIATLAAHAAHVRRARARCSKRAIVETPPAVLRDGGVIADGYDAELDELRRISEHSDEFLLELETRERERTGIREPADSATTACTASTSRSRAAQAERCRRTTSAARR